VKPFYINVTQDYGKILVTYIDKHGAKRREKREFFPTLYLRTPTNNQNVADEEPFYTIRGDQVYPFRPGNVAETREFIKKHSQIDNFEIFGLRNYPYEYISETFSGDVSQDWNEDLINIAYMDIEVRSDDGFPEPTEASKEVTAITVMDNAGTRVYGCGDYTRPVPNGKYIQCRDEMHLLMMFLQDWKANYPDIISGWNVKTFDLTYLINRIMRLCGEKFALQLSPWGKIRPVQKTFNGRPENWYDISGVATLDLLELYKKYGPPGQKESYSLNYIAHLELKEKKLSYSEYGSLHDLYSQDYEKFIDYNIKDTLLVKEIEKKRRLIKLAMILAYDSKVNFEDVFYQTRMWDSLIYNHLIQERVVPSPNEREEKDSAYEGAFVKDPHVGMHDWVVSFDYTSLYPSLMMQFNISPDTIVEPEDYPDDIRKFFAEHQYRIDPSLLLDSPTLPDFAGHSMVLAANGHVFRTDREGFLPTILRKMFADRQKYKKMYLAAKKEVEQLKHDGKDTREAEQRVAMYDLLQLCKKVCLNSCYGATGTPYFRYYDIRQAVAVTASGQYAIKYVEKHLNAYLNKLLNTIGKDYILAMDTDSVYIGLSALVAKVMGDCTDSGKIVDFLDRACQENLGNAIKKMNVAMSKYLGAATVDLDMKRESICNKAIWTAKKRYILSVCDQEGVRYETPEIKMSGIEAVKSSTPEVCRTKIKEAVKIIMTGKETDIHSFIAKFKSEFMKLRPEDIAFPRGVNGMNEYADRSTIFRKGTPIHVKGALIYNHQLRKRGLEKVYPLIKDGDKIKFTYVREPNPLGISVITFSTSLPKEFVDIQPYIDYNTQFEKTFIDPIQIILSTIGWNTEPKTSLGAFFK
jgi:DNA polymerase elongation subunit (family B)